MPSRETETVALSREYREYFAQLGRAIGEVGAKGFSGGHLQKTIGVGPVAARALAAETLDVVTERLAGPAFDS